MPRESDVSQERLYCIKYMDKFESKSWEEVMKKPTPDTDSCFGNVYYVSPTKEGLLREEKVISLIKENLCEWKKMALFQIMKLKKVKKLMSLLELEARIIEISYLKQDNFY